MLAHSTVKFKTGKSFRTVERKLYLTVEQEQTLKRWFIQCCRAYNRALEHRIKAWKRRKESVSYYEQQALLTQQRKNMTQLREVPVQFVRDALRRVDRAFKAFWRRLKAKAQKVGFPRFHAAHRYRSMECQAPFGYFLKGSVHIPGIGSVSSRGQDAVGKQKVLYISRRLDTWYAQVLVEIQDVPLVQPVNHVGLDMGLTHFATLSTGETIENPRWYRRTERKLRRASKSLARKQKGSKNRIKARNKLAREHERVKAQRKDFCHQESRKLVNRFSQIGFEKLNVKGLARGWNRKSIHDAAWGQFLFFLTYKAENAGKLAVPVPAAGTSQECPACGRVKPKSLSERVHNCECGLICDRDHASAVVVDVRALVIARASNLWRDRPLPDDWCRSASRPCEAGSL